MVEVHEIRLLLSELENICEKYFAKKYLTIEETCEYLHISKRTLQDYRDKHYLPFIQLKNLILFFD